MKKYISIIMALILTLTVTIGVIQAGAVAPNTAKDFTGVNITGKVKVSFEFNNDGTADLLSNGEVVQSVNIQADGTYEFTNVQIGNYSLIVSVPGWTDYIMDDIFISESDKGTITIYDETIYAGDVNKDSIVSLADISCLVSNLNKNVDASTVNSDVNHDGAISILDITEALQEQNYAHTSLPALFINNGFTYTY